MSGNELELQCDVSCEDKILISCVDDGCIELEINDGERHAAVVLSEDDWQRLGQFLNDRGTRT